MTRWSNRKPSGIAALLIVGASLSGVLAAQEPAATGRDLLAAALGRHDPNDAWSSGHFRLTLEGRRPDGTTSTTVFEVDNRRGSFAATRQADGSTLEAEIGPGDHCQLRLDGEADVPAQKAEALGLDCSRWRRMRDYYTYMWGLPMKLSDPGTTLADEIGVEQFNGTEAFVLKATYDPAVGSDTWYFYFDQATRQAVGYRFYHDQAANDGEYIVLEGEVAAGGVRFPRRQTWYMNDDDELLGSDELTAVERLD